MCHEEMHPHDHNITHFLQHNHHLPRFQEEMNPSPIYSRLDLCPHPHSSMVATESKKQVGVDDPNISMYGI